MIANDNQYAIDIYVVQVFFVGLLHVVSEHKVQTLGLDEAQLAYMEQ